MTMVGSVGSEMDVVDGMHEGQSQGVGRMLGDARALPDCEVIYWWHPITLPSRCKTLSFAKPESIIVLWKALAQDATRMLWLAMHDGAPRTHLFVFLLVCTLLVEWHQYVSV